MRGLKIGRERLAIFQTEFQIDLDEVLAVRRMERLTCVCPEQVCVCSCSHSLGFHLLYVTHFTSAAWSWTTLNEVLQIQGSVLSGRIVQLLACN